ncbi:vanadium-dependent haloperoxidase [Fibrella forsythiae]|uniref:Phosphatase PAP2 family protein n=1 Tax=Fibrella forsythiae TaxID=2817061 RepID=A0ABS3JQT6_9BACT|nr:vanadium-dependent haloperoxidase [Fibrella forsythiae]MBO0952358.1 phosphatase PAP2 family protein [Fibrella forsythiae]
MDNLLIWNAVALEANRVSHTNGKNEQTGPTLSSRALAIVHLALHDTYVAIKNPATWAPYLPEPAGAPANTAANLQLAMAGAAFTTLNTLYPAQKVYFDEQLHVLKGDRTTVAHKYGEKVARAIWQDRKFDPGASAGSYVPKSARNAHQPDPDNPTQGYHGPIYGAAAKGFAITERHELAAPHNDDAAYLAALKQVRYKGAKPDRMGTLPDSDTVEPYALPMTKRTPEETLIGLFWGYDGAPELGTPPRLYNQIIRKIAVAKGNTEAENVQLFTLVNVAMADAGILAWDQKYVHEFCRPVIGIRHYDKSSDPGSGHANGAISPEADPFWLPLGAPASNTANATVTVPQTTFPYSVTQTAYTKNFTPNFPAYPSGHATFGAAALHMTRLFYGPAEGGVSLPAAGTGNAVAQDTLLNALMDPDMPTEPIYFVSEEMNGATKNNDGEVRPLHRRQFNSLWDMILENGISRVYLGVHWVFDAFDIDENNPGQPVFSNDPTQRIGGIPLGLTIAEDIYRHRDGKGVRKSTVGRRI